MAFDKAKRRKRKKKQVGEFEYNMEKELFKIRKELEELNYQPSSPRRFFLREPKRRDIWVVDFRDRVVHHALCNIIEPIFDKSFIYDSYACRINRGTHKAIKRLDIFKRRVTKNNFKEAYVLKTDIKKYFDSISHEILLKIIAKKIKDQRTIKLIEKIIRNYQGKNSSKDKGMPIGNLTSQLFANIYLNELDHFMKEKLRVKHYLRYMDDLVVLDSSINALVEIKQEIQEFLIRHLDLKLHPQKTRIFPIANGIDFLGYQIFYYYKLLKRGSVKRILDRINILIKKYEQKNIELFKIRASIMAWLGYARHADIYRLENRLLENLRFLIG